MANLLTETKQKTALQKIHWKDYCSSDAANKFLYGECGVFAMALHQKFGYEIQAIAERETEETIGIPAKDRVIHIYCRDTNNRFVDIRGGYQSYFFFDRFGINSPAECDSVQLSDKDWESELIHLMGEQNYQNELTEALQIIDRSMKNHFII